MSKIIKITIPPAEAHHRVDQFLSRQGQGWSRSRIQQLIADGQITINGLPIFKASYLLRPGDEVIVNWPEPVKSEVMPEDIPLDILYEDDWLLVINKPAGMVVHPAAGNYSGTLVNALLHHCPFLSGIGGVSRPGIVHRLDKDTSGILVVAKTDSAHLSLSEQIKNKTVKRIYKALVYGVPDRPDGEINTQIGRHPADRKKMSTKTKRGRIAITHYQVEEYFPGYALLSVSLQTGRTHQIRVHLQLIHHPIVGDQVYGYNLPQATAKKYPQVYQAILNLKRQALHAQVLGFVHPEHKKYLEFSAPLPDDLVHLLDLLREIRK